MEQILRFFEKYLIPKSLYGLGQPIYHWLLSFGGALIYGFPSKNMIVIGVTGTKGKTTTCNLIHHILNSSGHKTGLSTTVNFKIGDKEWQNGLKQTMPGRFRLQKLLKQMKDAGCEYAVVETSSEGILQYRHKFIDYDMAVFLNISPEHIERHGSFENYRAAKVKLFEKVGQKGIGVYNLDDENASHFFEAEIGEKYGYSLKSQTANPELQTNHKVQIANCKLSADKTEFTANGINYKTGLVGEFNVYNCAAAITAATALNISEEKIKEALATFNTVSGRMEIVKAPQGFSVIVDYAHEPKSLGAVYKAVKETQMASGKSRMICLLGSCGGGRDKWKRPEMGKVASLYCDEIILANEDPYDENPEKILDDIRAGINREVFSHQKVYEIVDRKEAIKRAISMAKKGDAVVLTGKGGEMWMCVENGKKIPWDEKNIVESLFLEVGK